MPIMSYLAYPEDGQRMALVRALRSIPSCNVVLSENRDLVVVVTDTPDREAERTLQQQLQSIDALHCMTLIAGYDDPENQDVEQANADD